MFKNETVFILGAGASWHYGYPTGERLVKNIIQYANDAKSYFKLAASNTVGITPNYVLEEPSGNILQKWEKAASDCVQIKQKLETVNPPIIDYFLGHNPDLQRIGKFLIAWTLLKRELWFYHHGNINRRDDHFDDPFSSTQASLIDCKKFKDKWYRFILNQLLSDLKTPEGLLKNQVHFVTFNYDTSLETFIYQGLSSIQFLKQTGGNLAKEFLNDRVFHIYGQIREDFEQVDYSKSKLNMFSAIKDPDRQKGLEYKTFFDWIYDASKSIRTIGPDEKGLDEETIEKAQKAIKEAKVVYILGYGFDKNNNERLKLTEYLRAKNDSQQNKLVQFTNFEDSNLINKRAGRLFTNNPVEFLPPNKPVAGDTRKGPWFYEKSIRNVYEAIERDFDDLENQLTFRTKSNV